MAIITKEISITLSVGEVEKILRESLIEEGLIKSNENVTINFHIEEVGGDYMDRFTGTNKVTKVIVKSKE